MAQEHPEDFEKYGANIEEIIENPTYLARNEMKKCLVRGKKVCYN